MHTFVICAYKKSPFLEECIQSCINQVSVKKGYSKIIIYTSTPNQEIELLSSKYGLHLFTKKGGSIGKDWNNALSVVDTMYATIVHQDDVYHHSYGEMIIQEFESNTDGNIVFTDYEEIDSKGIKRRRSINLKIKTVGLKIMSLSSSKWYQRRVYAFGNFICCPAVSYNLKRLKEFRFNENMRMAVDWDAWERIMNKNGKSIYVDKKLMLHRIHEESDTTVNTTDRYREKEEREMFQRYWGKSITNILMKVYVLNQKSNQT